MIEKTKEEYNKKISELYAVIENKERIIRDLQEKNESMKTRIKTVKRRRKKQTQKKYKYKYRIDKALKYTHDRLGFLENCVGGNEREIRRCIKIFNKYLEILNGDNDE